MSTTPSPRIWKRERPGLYKSNDGWIVLSFQRMSTTLWMTYHPDLLTKSPSTDDSTHWSCSLKEAKTRMDGE